MSRHNPKAKFFLQATLLLSVFYSSCKTQDNLSGKWRINGTGILLTSFASEKEDFYDSCYNTIVIIKDDNIRFSGTCYFTKGALKIDPQSKRTISNLGALSIKNPEGLLGSIYDLSKETPPNRFTVYNVLPLSSNDADHYFLICLQDDRYVIISDPYYLGLSREK